MLQCTFITCTGGFSWYQELSRARWAFFQPKPKAETHNAYWYVASCGNHKEPSSILFIIHWYVKKILSSTKGLDTSVVITCFFPSVLFFLFAWLLFLNLLCSLQERYSMFLSNKTHIEPSLSCPLPSSS